MKFERASGILLHPTSFPGRYGIGDLGREAYQFVDFLAQTHQKLCRFCHLVQPVLVIRLMRFFGFCR